MSIYSVMLLFLIVLQKVSPVIRFHLSSVTKLSLLRGPWSLNYSLCFASTGRWLRWQSAWGTRRWPSFSASAKNLSGTRCLWAPICSSRCRGSSSTTSCCMCVSLSQDSSLLFHKHENEFGHVGVGTEDTNVFSMCINAWCYTGAFLTA